MTRLFILFPFSLKQNHPELHSLRMLAWHDQVLEVTEVLAHSCASPPNHARRAKQGIWTYAMSVAKEHDAHTCRLI